MKKLLGSALIAALMLSSGAALALDKVQGVFTNLDVPAGSFWLVTGENGSKIMRFQFAEKKDTSWNLSGIEDGDRVEIGFDINECGEDEDCTSTAIEIAPAS